MATEEPSPKFGAGHAKAMLQHGLAEIRAAAWWGDSNIAQPPTTGLYGTSTQREVYEARRSHGLDRDVVEPPQSPSLDDRATRASPEPQGREDRSEEPERD